MFTASTYKNRRQTLKKSLKEGLIVFIGNEQSGMNYADNHYRFRQDSSFLYYCGLDKPHLALIIDIDHGREILFGDDPTMDDIVWTGPVPSLKELAQTSGIDKAKRYEDIQSFLQKSSERPIHFLPPYRPEHTLKLSQWLPFNPGEVSGASSTTLIKSIVRQRSVKTEAEIEQIEEAVSITADMHLAAMQSARIGMKEYEVMSHIRQIALENNGDIAFPVILTTKGHILHNHGYGHTIQKNDMVLCDAGAENALYYGGDLTRTFPAGKQFTDCQHDLYMIVLDAQATAVETMKPGVKFMDVHLAACKKLVEGLKNIGLMKGNSEDAVTAGAYTLFFQCGLGHMLGLDTHDMENLGEKYVGYTPELKKSTEFGLKSLRLGRKLKTGFVVTVEPGIYMIPELIELRKSEGAYSDFVNYDKLEAFRNFGGIRIEDDYLITKNGSRLLGKPLPKRPEAIGSIRTKALY